MEREKKMEEERKKSRLEDVWRKKQCGSWQPVAYICAARGGLQRL